MTTTTQELKAMQLIEVTLKLRLGTTDDFRKHVFEDKDGRLQPVLKPNIGQSYWVKSQFTDEVDNKPYQITEETDWEEFRASMKQEMIYVAISQLDMEL